jgi:hypothetical protein
MRTRQIAVLLFATCLPLAACSAGEDGKPSAASSPAVVESTDELAPAPSPSVLALEEPAHTVGDGGTGELEVTPTTVVYTKEGGGETSTYGTFAVVTVKVRNVGAVPAEEVPPMSGGGWEWIAPDGEALDAGDGQAFNVVMDKYNNAGSVQPGSFHWKAAVFDLSPEQAKGGTLVYKDGADAAYRWKVPPQTSGPQAEEVRKQLEF